MSKRITTGFHENPQRGSVVATGFVQSNEKGDVISVISMSLWVYGYQRSHYLTYSGYIYIYTGFFCLLWNSSILRIAESFCKRSVTHDPIWPVSVTSSAPSLDDQHMKKNLEGLGEMLRQYDSWTMIMIQIWDLPGPTSMHHLVLRLPIIGLFFGWRLTSDSQIPCLRDFVHGISTCPPWLEKPLTCHA